MNRGIKSALSVIVVLVLMAATGLGVYIWRQTRINDLTSQNQQLQEQVSRQSQPTQTTTGAGNQNQNQNAGNQYLSDKGVTVVVFVPSSGDTVKSPLFVMGKVPGNWSFEAQFPVRLEDSSGKVVGQAVAHLQDDWMTTSLVPFTASITFSGVPAGTGGKLVLVKDNPSGLAQNADSVSVPIKF